MSLAIEGPHLYSDTPQSRVPRIRKIASVVDEIDAGSYRLVIVAGATGAVGEATLEMLVRRGDSVGIGTRSEQGFQKAVERLAEVEDLSFDARRVRPFIADLNDQQQVRRATRSLGEEGRSAHCINLAAAGMEQFSSEYVLKGVIKMGRKVKGELKNFSAALEEYYQQVSEQVSQAHRRGDTLVNIRGAINLIEEAMEYKDRGVETYHIFCSSFPSTFFPQFYPRGEKKHGMVFYKGVAATKFAFERWLEKNAERLMDRGVYPVIASGSLLADTQIRVFFKAVKKHLEPVLTEEQQRRLNLDLYPVTADLAQAVVDVLDKPPGPDVFPEWPGRVYVHAPGDITREPPAKEDLQRLQLPF